MVRKFTLVVMVLTTLCQYGCASLVDNPFDNFLVERPEAPLEQLRGGQYMEIEWLGAEDTPKLMVISENEGLNTYNALSLQNYILIAGSAFQGAYVDRNLALATAKQIGATLVVYTSTFEDSRNITSMAQTSAITFGTSNSQVAFNNAIPTIDIDSKARATTLYSVPITNTVDRYNQNASYYVRAKNAVGLAKLSKINVVIDLILKHFENGQRRVIEDACSRSSFITDNFDCELEKNIAKLVSNQNFLPEEEQANAAFYRNYGEQIEAEEEAFLGQLYGIDEDIDAILSILEQDPEAAHASSEGWRRLTLREITIGEYYRTVTKFSDARVEALKPKLQSVFAENANKY